MGRTDASFALEKQSEQGKPEGTPAHQMRLYSRVVISVTGGGVLGASIAGLFASGSLLAEILAASVVAGAGFWTALKS